MIDPQEALAPSRFIDSDHPAIQQFAATATDGCTGEREKAIKLCHAVRDDIRYDCYQLDLSEEGMSASGVLQRGFGFCVPKAVLLAAACRTMGIPASLGFADVRNHLSTPKLTEIMGSDIFYYHGYTAIYLDGRWLKATPAFDRDLCEKARIAPLDFDGVNDSIFHAQDKNGRRHMEYLRYHGEFVDLPYKKFIAVMEEHYPKLMELSEFNWDDDINKEFSQSQSADKL